MKRAMRVVLGVVAGMVLAFALVVAVEAFSSVVHPLPEDFKGDIPGHVKRYPGWVLGLVVAMWGATGAAAAWVATRIGNRVAGGVVTLLLAWALIFNLSMLPYASWFKIVMPIALVIACVMGIRSGGRRRGVQS